jgi:hypothetical protein
MNETSVIELVSLGVLLSAALTGFWSFDRLVRLEYASYREQWEADGRPHGIFWVPRECMGQSYVRFGCTRAMNRCSIAWLFKTPEWMRQNGRALHWVWWMRVTTLIWYVGVLGWLFLFILA